MSDLTVKEFSENTGINYPAASTLVRVMKANGFIEEVGVKRAEGSKGKGSKVYQFTSETFQKLTEFFATKLETAVEEPVEAVQVEETPPTTPLL